MRSKALCLCLGVVVALCLALPTAAADDAPTVPLPDPALETAQGAQDAQDTCRDYTPPEPEEAEPALALLQTDADAVAPGCKACKDRPTCNCFYNGQPRVSCNPCCYRNNFTGQVICRD